MGKQSAPRQFLYYSELKVRANNHHGLATISYHFCERGKKAHKKLRPFPWLFSESCNLVSEIRAGCSLFMVKHAMKRTLGRVGLLTLVS